MNFFPFSLKQRKLLSLLTFLFCGGVLWECIVGVFCTSTSTMLTNVEQMLNRC